MDFNPSKIFTMTVSRKTTDVLHPPLFLAGPKIKTETDTYKQLGIHSSNNLSWAEYIRTITRTAWQRLNMLRGLKFRLKRFSLEKIYTSFIQPLLEFSDSIWDNLNQGEINLLESVHTEAARIVLGAMKLCNIKRLLSDLSWN